MHESYDPHCQVNCPSYMLYSSVVSATSEHQKHTASWVQGKGGDKKAIWTPF